MKFPDKKYQIIYADPPWRYRDTLGGNAKMGAMPYPTMAHNDICALPVRGLADKNCILFLWVTMPKLQEGLDVIRAWGFEYKTCGFTWVKQNKGNNKKPPQFFYPTDKAAFNLFSGLGRWVAGNAELCLLATSGKPHRISKSIKQIVISPRGRHSAKPNEVRNRIVELMGDLPRIELFARQEVEGWDAWGNEIRSDSPTKED